MSRYLKSFCQIAAIGLFSFALVGCGGGSGEVVIPEESGELPGDPAGAGAGEQTLDAPTLDPNG